MPFGMLDTQYIDLPAGIDEAYIRGLESRSGYSYAQLLQELDSRLAALNTGLDPMLASLIVPTTDPFAEANGPIAFEIEERTERTLARPQYVEGQGHMLPLRSWDVTLGLTEDGLESMRLKRILANVDSLFKGFVRLYRKRIMMRLTSDAEWRVDKKTTVRSPGFAGSGTGDNVFSQPYPDGRATANGYTLYYRCAAAALAATLKVGLAEMVKWHPGYFDMVGPESMLSLVTQINPGDPQNGFVSAGTPLVRGSQNDAEAQVDPEIYLGVLFGKIRVRKAIDDHADPNLTVYKSYGDLAEGNPLAWRYDELKGREAFVRSRSLHPLAEAQLIQSFDIGVNNRVGAFNVRVADSGGYQAPSIA